MRLIGIDPGSYITGYAVIDEHNRTLNLCEGGLIKIPATIDKYHRLQILYEKIDEIVSENAPECAASEDTFYHKNVKTSLYLGQIRGAIILALLKNKCRIFEYSPLEIKQAVVGYGHASKDQVEFMVKRLLNIESKKISHDCSDAIATAICLSSRILNLALDDGQTGKKTRASGRRR